MDFMLENVPNVVAACVILHNICEVLGDHFQSEWKLLEEHSETQARRVEVKKLLQFMMH